MTTLSSDLWYNFIRAHRCLIREIEHRLAEEKLPPYAWYDALWGIESGKEGARRMHELADVLAIERYNLTRLVDRLEKEGFVVREKSCEDGRGAIARITDTGRALRKRMWKVYKEAVEELFLVEFDEERRRIFAAALENASRNTRNPRKAAQPKS
ncbi:MarR family winged helix-turn-helix transcriptional regulator [Pseudomonas fuscovaginae UPB0736]|uniref:Transcriptional regulator, MarR family n=1 Tax=Pseudomonas asplenii TaxID=53407 RepID=A0A1H6NNN5_9PSED|nr:MULTISPECIES: MarR family winged helix-turn-helix transcriptional regulator [Pseudomonas]UUQ65603.1 MarR family winged helix-turn-helix transcriptional regulator [Pseudomonas fuscovaginae UPB0736]UZE31192.1 MarR family winged helix-turn-helix transcriptional regulator [Pseudomonas asplenii]SDT34310.1 transcriptional regulator, MarR family [Pseudomonas asplenii]SEI17499.1 transcriptional regulator, MarR family [Pseudomonas fuscovaginae]